MTSWAFVKRLRERRGSSAAMLPMDGVRERAFAVVVVVSGSVGSGEEDDIATDKRVCIHGSQFM